MNGKFFRNGIVTLVLVVGTVALLYTFLGSPTNETAKPYSVYLADVRAGLVTKVTQQDLTLTVTAAGNPASRYTTIQPGLGIPSALQETVDAAKAVIGTSLDAATLKKAAAAAEAIMSPASDARGPVEYRKHVGGIMVTRALTRAAARAS